MKKGDMGHRFRELEAQSSLNVMNAASHTKKNVSIGTASFTFLVT